MKKLIIPLILMSCNSLYEDVEVNEYECKQTVISYASYGNEPLFNNPQDTNYHEQIYEIEDTATTLYNELLEECLEASDTIIIRVNQSVNTTVIISDWNKLN